VRVDPAWGVSGVGGAPRAQSSEHLPYAVRGNESLPFHGYASHALSPGYERCKATQRCARGYEHYYQGSATARWTTQAYAGGRHEEVFLFAPFEDWRPGTGAGAVTMSGEAKGTLPRRASRQWCQNGLSHALAQAPGAGARAATRGTRSTGL